jgi:hypothetical protein
MAGLQGKAAATQSSRKPSPFVSGSSYHYSTCYRSAGRSRMFKLRLGLGWGFRAYARILLFGALLAACGSRFHVFLLCLILHRPHLRRRLCVCACILLDRFTLSLSLSPYLNLYTTSRCLCISLFLLCRSTLECLCKKKQRQMQS